MLNRRDAPPDGVPGQFAFVSGGADESCDGFEHSARGVYVDDFFLAGTFGADRPELGTYFEVCFPGFVLRQSLRVEVRPPGQPARVSTASEFGVTGIVFLGWTSFPGDPLGTYEVTATQGLVRVSGSFTVSPASRPRVVVDPPALSPDAPPPPPGTPFLVYVTGFQPGADAPLYLYRLEPDEAGRSQGQMRYVTTIWVPMDASGQGIHNLATTADDPPGMYCIIVRAPGREPNYVNECSGWGLNDFYLAE